jgi:hypothetical protein
VENFPEAQRKPKIFTETEGRLEKSSSIFKANQNLFFCEHLEDISVEKQYLGLIEFYPTERAQ